MIGEHNLYSFDVHITTKNSGPIKDMSNDSVNLLLQEQVTVQTKALELLGWVVEVDVISCR